jgi:hypothetical protein
VVLGCLLWHFQARDHLISGTHQSWSWVSFWDLGKHLFHPFFSCLFARIVCKQESPQKGPAQCALFPPNIHAQPPFPQLKRCSHHSQLAFPRVRRSVPCFESTPPPSQWASSQRIFMDSYEMITLLCFLS